MTYESAVKRRNQLFFEDNKHLFKSRKAFSSRYSIGNDSKPRNIVLFCSGLSVLDLSLDQLIWLRDCADVIIAVNKTFVYANLAGIVPSHLFLMDAHTAESRYALQRSFDFCFFNQVGMSGAILRRSVLGCVTHVSNELLASVKTCLSLPDVRSLEEVSPAQWRQYYESSLERIKFYAPVIPEVHYLNWQPWNDRSNIWSGSLIHDLYHFRGSFTSLLNYACIQYPGSHLYALGADFNGSQYFFQAEIDSEPAPYWGDCWTKPLISRFGRHFSAQSYKGSTMFDQSEYINLQMKKFGCTLFSFNPRSLLVSSGMAIPSLV